MMARLMRWRPWTPPVRKKFRVILRVQSLESLSVRNDSEGQHCVPVPEMAMMVELKWCRPERPLGRSQKTDRTTNEVLEHGCTVNWQQEFQHLCILTRTREHMTYKPFHVHFTIVQLENAIKTVFGRASINLADLASTEIQEQTVKLNIKDPEQHQKHKGTLEVTVSFSEDAPLKCHNLDSAQISALSSPGDQQIQMISKQKAKPLRKRVSFCGTRAFGELDYFVCGGKLCVAGGKRSDHDEEVTDNESAAGSEGQKIADEERTWLQSYGSLTGVNLVVEGALPSLTETREDPSIPSRDVSNRSAINNVSSSEPNQSVHIRQFLSRKISRKSRFLSERGEPLLRKSNKDTGGDDFDLVRHLSFTYSDGQGQKDDHTLLSSTNISECLNCGDVQFSVGCWERKELVSRVGHMKITTNVFFASIDQRSERAGGESACAALVVVIADWLHQNPSLMPIRADFDMLIRQGSAEWRTLCDNDVYRRRFPDQHFDLDTVLEAKIRPLGIAEGGIAVGFFKPDIEDSSFDFLHGAMLFDDIWEAIIVQESLLINSAEHFQPVVYIVSWNDHFFLLKVDKEAFYIIDTLGERLFEGCKQAYMICFDKETILTHHLVAEKQSNGQRGFQNVLSSQQTGMKDGISSAGPPNLISLTKQSNETAELSHHQAHQPGFDNSVSSDVDDRNEIEYTGRDACKEFIKGFFAALALRQLYKEIETGLSGRNPLHSRLQIEFHRTCRS